MKDRKGDEGGQRQEGKDKDRRREGGTAQGGTDRMEGQSNFDI